MNVSRIKNTITRCVENNRFKKEAKFLDNHVVIHNDTTYGDSYNQMVQARKTLANYAKHEKVKIDIFDARHELGEHDGLAIEDKLSDKLSVYVKDKRSGKEVNKIVSARTDQTYPHVTNDYIVIDYPEDGLQMTRITKHEHEDNFLKHLYRNIENMVKELHKK